MRYRLYVVSSFYTTNLEYYRVCLRYYVYFNSDSNARDYYSRKYDRIGIVKFDIS